MRDHHQALMEVLRRTSATPHWIQLPFNPSEDFLVQFCEGLPGLRTKPTVLIENASSRFKTELVEFYRDYLAVTKGKMPLDKTRFAVSRHAAPGLYLLVEALQGWDPWLVKGQITGPITILSGIQDEEGHCAYRDERTRDVVVKLLAQKARWQAELLKSLGRRAIVFVNEHVLGRTDGFLNVTIAKEGKLACLIEVLQAIRDAGVWSGVHICSDEDWGTILESELNVFSFDSYSHFDRMKLLRKEIADFLKRDGMLAWGIVPTEPKALRESQASDLAELWIAQVQELAIADTTLTDIYSRSFITPSCGLDKIDEKLAIRAMDLTIMVSNILRVIIDNLDTN